MTEDRRTLPDRRNESISVQMARLEERHNASREALLVAKTEIDRRLLEMNEMRLQIATERGSFLSRAEFEAKHEIQVTTIASLKNFQYMVMGGLLAVQILIGAVIHFWK